VYFLFRGVRRGSGELAIGRLVARDEEAVHKMLDAHAIDADVVGPEEAIGLFPPAVQAALQEAGLRITFNQLAKVMEGHGVWILDHEKIRGRVMQLAREALGDGEDQQPVLRRLEQMLESLYGDQRSGAPPAGGEGGSRFANADEVRAEVRRIQAAIRKLERELVSVRSRPAGERGPRRSDRRSGPRDRTQDEVLREIFEHNLELMNLTWEQGISAPSDQ
jgi:hypothetical protein